MVQPQEPNGAVDEARRRAFEEAWGRGARPNLADFLPPSSSAGREATLVELVCIELELGWKAGLAPRLEDYLGSFPELGEEAVLRELLVEEFGVRQRHGDQPSADSYVERFPAAFASVAEARSVLGEPAIPAKTPSVQGSVPKGARRLGRYELIGEIGRGGFARVWRAFDTALARTVALKLLHPELRGDARQAERFVREGRNAARLRHPRIVPVFEVGEEEGELFLVTALVEGETLEARLAARTFDPREAAELLLGLAEALDYAHQRGVVHRDVKPANVLLDQDGEAHLTDFGLALADVEPSLTVEGDLLGTPAYMSPEQARGATVDARTDVYALGAVLYRALTGRLPFEGPWSQVLAERQSSEPPRPRALEPGLPVDLETICLVAMATEPERRYASAALLAEDLRCFLAARPIHARPVGPLQRGLLLARRNPVPTLIALTGFLLIGVVAFIGARGVLRERDRFQRERDVAQGHLYHALLNEARAVVQGQTTGWWWHAMGNIRRAAALDTEERDSVELAEHVLELHGQKNPCLRLVGEVDGPVANRVLLLNASEALVGGMDGSVAWVDLSSGSRRALTSHGGPVTGMALVGDQLVATVATDGVLRLTEIESGTSKAKDLDAGSLIDLAVAPDGSALATGTEAGDVLFLELDSPATGPLVLEGHTGAIAGVAFAPAGDQLVSSAEDMSLRVWPRPERGTSTGPAQVVRLGDTPDRIAFHRAGQVIVSLPKTFGVSLVPLDGGLQRPMNVSHSAAVEAIVVRGSNFVTAGRDGRLKVWHGANALAVAEGGYERVQDLHATPDGRTWVAAYADGKLRTWEFLEPPHRRFLPLEHAASFGPDGRLFTTREAYAFGAGGMEWQDLLPPGITALVAHPSEGVMAAASADGRLCIVGADGAMRFETEQAGARCLAADAVGMHFASGTAEGELALFAWEDGAEIVRAALPSEEAVRELRLSPAGGAATVAVRQDEATWLWMPEEGRLIEVTLADGDRPTALGFASGELLVGTERGELIACDLATGSERMRVRVHGSEVTAIAGGEGGLSVYCGSSGGEIASFTPGTLTEEVRFPAPYGVRSIAIDPKEGIVAGLGGGLAFWNLDGTQLVNTILQGPTSLAWSARTERFYVGCAWGSIAALPVAGMQRVYRERTGDSAGEASGFVRFDEYETLLSGGHTLTAWDAEADPSGRFLATCAHDGSVKLWGLEGESSLLWARDDAHLDPVWSVAFDRKGERLASASTDTVVWEVESGRELVRLVGDELATGVGFFANRPWLATCDLGGSVRVWDLTRGTELGRLAEGAAPFHALQFAPDGKSFAAACGDGRVLLWQVPEGLDALPRDPTVLHAGPDPIWALAFRHDGQVLAAADEVGGVELWRPQSGQRILRMRTSLKLLRAASFDPTGRRLALGTYLNGGVVWDLEGVARSLAKIDQSVAEELAPPGATLTAR